MTGEESVEGLERRLQAEREARLEAEQIAERATREGYQRERELAMLEIVASAANRASSVQDALQVALDSVCEHVDWPVGHAFLVDRRDSSLRSARVWSLRAGDDLAGFKQVSETIRLEPGLGIPGHVVAQEAGIWLADATIDARSARQVAAANAGLYGAFAAPIVVNEEILGVLEFFSRQREEPDEHTLDVVTVVGLQVGRVFERQQMRERLEREAERSTADLDAANSELEAFCYSVSHDLRTPLRSIDSSIRALLEGYREALDQDARDYLDGIGAASQRMRQLIDDVLTLLQVSRVDLEHEHVDLSTLARQIGRDIAEVHPDHAVEFEVEDGLAVEGDARLLTVLLSNLLENSWKFSAGRAPAHVQVAGERGGVVVVRDDGAGFDMEHAESLFRAFQRLHPVDEYPGTGLGLATAQRIVHRHGGQIWGHGEVDRGATLPFSLNDERLAQGTSRPSQPR